MSDNLLKGLAASLLAKFHYVMDQDTVKRVCSQFISDEL